MNSARLLAFIFDLWLFSAGYFVTLALTNGPRPLLGAAWYAAFCAYHGLMLSRGGATVGKKLLGLKVVAAGGEEPPTFAQGFARALGYLLSGFFNLGFIWALFSKDSRAWHDYVAGTRVVEAAEKAKARRVVEALAAWALGAVLVGGWAFLFIGLPRYAEMQQIASAKMSLEALGRMQEAHKQINGAYTDDLYQLARLADDWKGFIEALDRTVQVKDSLKITLEDGGYRIEARARDEKSTVVSVKGPRA